MKVHVIMCITILIACVHCLSASCGRFEALTEDTLNRRLLGFSSFPWLVSVQNHRGFHLAMGTIISEFWIITAPSALKLRKDLLVVVGITKLDNELHTRAYYTIDKVIIHEEFDEILDSNDLILLMTKKKIRFSSRVQPICFPNLDPQNSALSNCMVSGWMGVKDAGEMVGKGLRCLLVGCLSGLAGDDISKALFT